MTEDKQETSKAEGGDITVSQENARKAEELKDRANQCFKGVFNSSTDGLGWSCTVFNSTDKNFDVAVDYYTKAIELNPYIAVFYGNRSFAYLKTESYGYALTDASKALDLDSKYIKVSSGIAVVQFWCCMQLVW